MLTHKPLKKDSLANTYRSHLPRLAVRAAGTAMRSFGAKTKVMFELVRFTPEIRRGPLPVF